jgi:glutaredoxin
MGERSRRRGRPGRAAAPAYDARMSLRAAAALLACALAAAASAGEVYHWVDESGTVHFGDRPPADGRKATRDTLPEYAPSPPPAKVAVPPIPRAAPAAAPAAGPARLRRDAKVDLYVTAWCPYCKKARAWFDERGIRYTAYDIDADEAAAARRFAFDGRRGIPYAVIDGVHVSGFGPKAYEEALRAR